MRRPRRLSLLACAAPLAGLLSLLAPSAPAQTGGVTMDQIVQGGFPQAGTPAWHDRIDQVEDLLRDRCPIQRALTLYFSESGDDSLSGLDPAHCKRTLATARAILLENPEGNIRLRFRRGDRFTGLTGLELPPNTTIDDFGDAALPRPLFTCFYQVSPDWQPVPGSSSLYAATLLQTIYWVRDPADIEFGFHRRNTLATLEATPGSWWFDEGGDLGLGPRTLIVHWPGGSPPGLIEVALGGQAGVLIPTGSGGCRVRNIRSHGWGMQDPDSQFYCFESLLHDDDVAVIENCEALYGPRHVIGHLASGAGGGRTLWDHCRFGLGIHHISGMTAFVTFAQYGGLADILEHCSLAYGSLRTEAYDSENLGVGIYAHNAAGYEWPLGVIICRGTLYENPARNKAGALHTGSFGLMLPVVKDDWSTYRCFFVDERAEGVSSIGFPRDSVVAGGVYRAVLEPGQPRFGFADTARTPLRGAMLFTTLSFDFTRCPDDNIGLWNQYVGSLADLDIVHCRIDVLTRPGQLLGFDFNGYGENQSALVRMFNSILTNSGAPAQPPGQAWVNIPNADPWSDGGGFSHCAFFGLGAATSPPGPLYQGYDHSLAPVALDDLPAPDAVPSGLLLLGGPLPSHVQLAFDQNGAPVPLGVRFIGPIAPPVPACRADYNGDTLVNSQDFFDYLTAFFTAPAQADFNADGATNSQDFFDFLSSFFSGC